MDIKLFTNDYAATLKAAIQRQEKRQEAIAQNIAHAEDPGYKKADSNFSAILDKTTETSRLKATNSKHITQVTQTTSSAGIKGAVDNPEVDLTEEMVNLTDNQIRYDFSTRALGRYYRGLSAAIIGRN